jgi:hypothetical protein
MKSPGNLFKGFASIALATAVVAGCSKSSDTTSTTSDKVSVYLTDDPSMYDNVFIDIRYVEVKIQEGYKNEDHVGDKDDDADDHFDDNDDDHSNDGISKDRFGKWDTLAIRPGVYDILKLRNGIDTLFAQGAVKGRVRKIRLTLGDNNSIVKSGVSYPLALHSGVNKYVYVKIHNRHHDRISADHIGIWIDFDIANSIVEQNNHFFLKPFLKPFCEGQFGRVSGKVFPADAHALIGISNVNDAGVAIANKSGEYKIRGLEAGTYSITFKGLNGYNDTTLTNIKVAKGSETAIPNVTLRK